MPCKEFKVQFDIALHGAIFIDIIPFPLLGFLEVADFLIKAGANIELGASTPLMESAQEGHIELTKYLLQNGADVNAQSGTGDTALTYACENGHTDVSDLLLKYNAVLVRILEY